MYPITIYTNSKQSNISTPTRRRWQTICFIYWIPESTNPHTHLLFVLLCGKKISTSKTCFHSNKIVLEKYFWNIWSKYCCVIALHVSTASIWILKNLKVSVKTWHIRTCLLVITSLYSAIRHTYSMDRISSLIAVAVTKNRWVVTSKATKAPFISTIHNKVTAFMGCLGCREKVEFMINNIYVKFGEVIRQQSANWDPL